MTIDGFDPDELAELTEGLTGSDLRLVLREAVLDALTEERTTLTQDDLRRAVEGFEERDNLKNMEDFDNWRGSPGSSDHEHDHDGQDGHGDHDGHDHGQDGHEDHEADDRDDADGIEAQARDG
jgi:ABC-type Zn2+ transport system substrate-binding protein/surface adhesin